MADLDLSQGSTRGIGYNRSRDSNTEISAKLEENTFDQAVEAEAILDFAEDNTRSITNDGNELTIKEYTGKTHPYIPAGGFLDWTGANAGAGEDTIIKGYIKVDGTNYRGFDEGAFLSVDVPSPVATPFPRSADTQAVPDVFIAKQDVKYTMKQLAEGGGWNTIDVTILDGER